MDGIGEFRAVVCTLAGSGDQHISGNRPNHESGTGRKEFHVDAGKPLVSVAERTHETFQDGEFACDCLNLAAVNPAKECFLQWTKWRYAFNRRNYDIRVEIIAQLMGDLSIPLVTQLANPRVDFLRISK